MFFSLFMFGGLSSGNKTNDFYVAIWLGISSNQFLKRTKKKKERKKGCSTENAARCPNIQLMVRNQNTLLQRFSNLSDIPLN